MIVVAIEEREEGNGIVQRARMVKKMAITVVTTGLMGMVKITGD